MGSPIICHVYIMWGAVFVFHFLFDLEISVLGVPTLE